MMKSFIGSTVVGIAIATVALPCLATTKGSYASVHHEQRDGNRASGVSFTTHSRGMGLGISTNKITSNKPLERHDRTTTYPVYAFAKLALPTTIAPYVEIGVDLGDYLQHEINNDSDTNHNNNETSKMEPIDVYGAVGIKTSMRHAPIDVALYIKSYAVIFNGSNISQYSEQLAHGNAITMSGANIIFNF